MQSDKQTADSTEINSEEEIVLLVNKILGTFLCSMTDMLIKFINTFYPEFKTAKSLKI